MVESANTPGRSMRSVMIRVLAIPLAVILGSVLPAGSAAQEPETAMLRVRVLDSYDGTPVVGARVGLVNVDL